VNVAFIEPSFPANQKQFVRALSSVGAAVIGIGERPADWLDDDVKGWLTHYEQVASVVDVGALVEGIGRVQSQVAVDRLEATVEAHIVAAAEAREACSIAGTSVRTAYLCRDKPTMKEVLRQAGVPTAHSTAASTADEVREFARREGFPLIIKPRAGAGASGTVRIDDFEQLERNLAETPFDYGASVAVEEFVEGHEAFYDTVTIGGQVAHEFVCHYYPNVLEAMRTRWISPQFIATNRVDVAEGYQQVKVLGQAVIEALGIETSATHMEWFFGPKGLRFSEIGCRPPGVGAWDLYCEGNEIDLYREWALAVCYGQTGAVPTRAYSAGLIALRPDRDGVIAGYIGLDEVRERFGQWLIDYHLPPAGTPTQPVEAGYMANAWIRMKHPDYDQLREMLDRVGEIVQVQAS
jgi:carbamoylphosphate synthase large subunit